MATKDYQLKGMLVTVYKRRGARSLRLSIGSNRKVRVTIPAWAPFKVGEDFAKSRYDWLQAQLDKQLSGTLSSGQPVGKAHHLLIRPAEVKKVTTRITNGSIVVNYPVDSYAEHASVQAAAEQACFRALKKQAQNLLPARLHQLAGQYGFTYSSVQVRQLKRRWGSCNSEQQIVFNFFLMQLPWDLIDYVILHELVHTQVLNHGPDFWQAMEQVLPDARKRRKALRQFQAELFAG